MSAELSVSAAKPAVEEACRSCGEAFAGDPGVGPFGFRVIACPKCESRVWDPLARGVRVGYWIILVLSAIAMFSLVGSGVAVLPGAASLVAAIIVIVDARLRKSFASVIAVTALITALTVSGLVAAVVSAGLSHAYTTEVVDRPADVVAEFDSVTFAEGSQLCGGGDDYSACVNMHIAMYNSVCSSSGLTLEQQLAPSAQDSCDRLSSFIDDIRASSASCGFGCTTQANSDGRWGWAYLQPVSSTRDVEIDQVTHEESCWFSVGVIHLGYCPRTSG